MELPCVIEIGVQPARREPIARRALHEVRINGMAEKDLASTSRLSRHSRVYVKRHKNLSYQKSQFLSTRNFVFHVEHGGTRSGDNNTQGGY